MSQYKPDNLASGEATQTLFKEDNTPQTGPIVGTLLRLAMRRIPGFGFGAIHGGKSPSTVKNAVTMGSHGGIK